MAEVVFLGFGDPDGFGPDVGAEIVLDGVGKPIFEKGQSRIYSSATNFDTDGKDEFLGAIGVPIFDGTIEISRLPPLLQDFDNTGKNVEFGGVGKPVFPGVAELTDAINNFNTTGKDVVLLPGGIIESAEVTFFTTPIDGPTSPVQGPTFPPGVG